MSARPDGDPLPSCTYGTVDESTPGPPEKAAVYQRCALYLRIEPPKYTNIIVRLYTRPAAVMVDDT